MRSGYEYGVFLWCFFGGSIVLWLMRVGFRSFVLFLVLVLVILGGWFLVSY